MQEKIIVCECTEYLIAWIEYTMVSPGNIIAKLIDYICFLIGGKNENNEA